MLREPCLHETHGVPTENTVADYHPLTFTEMRDYILLAFNDNSKAAAVQVRLNQGIKGMVCPHEIEGPVAAKGVALDQVFIDSLHAGDPAGAIAKIGDILELTPLKTLQPLKFKQS